MEKGLVHVYCGDGKGKTTAAAGLAVRAAGSGRNVIFAQFMKGNDSGELTAMKQLPGIEIIRNSKNYGFYHQMSSRDKEAITEEHNRMLAVITERINGGKCDMLILDEFTYPYNYGLIDRVRVKRLVKNRPAAVEVVITGREPAEIFLEQADYITEMKCIRHPYNKGIQARRGIEY